MSVFCWLPFCTQHLLDIPWYGYSKSFTKIWCFELGGGVKLFATTMYQVLALQALTDFIPVYKFTVDKTDSCSYKL